MGLTPASTPEAIASGIDGMLAVKPAITSEVIVDLLSGVFSMDDFAGCPYCIKSRPNIDRSLRGTLVNLLSPGLISHAAWPAKSGLGLHFIIGIFYREYSSLFLNICNFLGIIDIEE